MFTHTERSQGFTLIETIVYIAIFAVMMLTISNVIVSFYRINAYTIAQSYQIDAARRGIENMVQDLREMTYADDGSYPLRTTGPYEIGFYSDIDRDNSVEYITYSLSSNTLYKRIYNATGTPLHYSTGTPDQILTLSTYVQNADQSVPIFQYYDTTGTQKSGSSTIADIRYIGVKLIVNIDPVRDPGEFVLRSSASLRNLTQ